MGKYVVVRGAAEHNLKGIDVRIPRNRLSVVTGLSGSGKSSLAYDIIYREGQRRFVESLSAYARQYMGRLDKPRVEHIEGLSPTISIDQKTISRNPRSTVGTITEILDHLRLLYARLGTPHCPRCEDVITSRTVDGIVQQAYRDWEGETLMVTAPIVLDRKGEYRKELDELRQQGFVRVRVDGEIRRLDEDIPLARYERHTIEVVYDRLTLSPERRSRFSESVEKALELGNGLVQLVLRDVAYLRSSRFACPRCDIDLPELEPRLFSFNSPHGSCPRCEGLGKGHHVDLGRLIPDPEKTLRDGALATMRKNGVVVHAKTSLKKIEALGKKLGFDLDTPWARLPREAQEAILQGHRSSGRGRKVSFAGIVPAMEETYRSSGAAGIGRWLRLGPCPQCLGTRLRPEARAVRFRDQTLPDVANCHVSAARALVASWELEPGEAPIGAPILREILERLKFLEQVGLGYLSLDRSADTLSGGEAQRIRLASQVGSGLRGVLYVLDEPSIGLHPRDNAALLETLRSLRDLGNTVLVVEHDRETIEAADHVIDIGPGAGVHGGELIEAGTVAAIRKNPRSVTGRFLSGKESIAIPAVRRQAKGWLKVRGARQHNLKNLDVDFPIGALTVVTGVSGSGKSTLVSHILHRAVARSLGLECDDPGIHRRIDGIESFDKIIQIDQSPIGRTPRSNPGTYTKVFDEIRDLFAATPDAKVRGYLKGRFSFNVKGGRCENCGGAGVLTINMQFMADVEVTCEECGGRRYNAETLEICYRGHDISQILDLPIEEACEFFVDHPRIHRTLRVLVDVGLGYVRLGQPSTTLSGGEAQRVKLAHELRKIATGQTLYLFDEPTTGLHFADIRLLLKCVDSLVERGNTVVIIEHNLDVAKVADHIIDLGPGGGDEGGELVAAGTPEQVAKSNGATGPALARELAGLFAPVPRKGRRSGSGGLEPEDRFVVVGAREHNLKNVRVEVPRGKMTVITGPSGSGKSTLAFDILFAEGQRRYVESLSTYARRFLGRMQRADVDRVEGIAPAIAIDQKTRSSSPRSTVATTTEIYDYLRILYARTGRAHCPECDAELVSTTPSAASRRIEKELAGEKVYILAPLRTLSPLDDPIPEGESLRRVAGDLLKEGFVRVLIGESEQRLEDLESGTLRPADTEEVRLVVDRLVPGTARGRLAESVEEAYRRGRDRLEARTRDGARRLRFTRLPACPDEHFALTTELTPRLFSFNHHSGACQRCHGLGHRRELDPELLFNDPAQAAFDGAMDHRLGKWISRPRGRVRKVVEMAFSQAGLRVDRPVSKLGKKARGILIEGTGERVLPVRYRGMGPRGRRWRVGSTWEGLGALIRRWHERAESPRWRQSLEERMRVLPCSLCDGGRLRPELLRVRVGGKAIHEVCRLAIHEALGFFDAVDLSSREEKIAQELLLEVRERLRFLLDVGLDYLTLDRAAETLSGGEAQRIRLATQIGNRLVGVLYVLDEPTIGLHQRDNERLLASLTALRDHGNSVVVVEHDEQTIRIADHVIDLGPGSGEQGGEIVAEGTAQAISRVERSVTGQYLSGREQVPIPTVRRKGSGEHLVVRGARANNLQDIDVEFPLGTLTAVTGVSGSGKSSLVMDILAKGLARELNDARELPGRHQKLEGVGFIDALGIIDQTPLGRSPKSNAATYTGVFTHIRELFARLPQAKARGYGKGRFSYNVAVGRCAHCEGKGSLLVEMHFLSDVWVPCEECGGRRYNRETLGIRYRGQTIADVLDLRIREACSFFENHPRVVHTLQVLEDVGLGYLALGQAATTLSGGEAQRVKLAAELGRPPRGHRLYILDEPTTGLHFGDVRKLVMVLQRLVDRGDTVVVIEHNLDVIKSADHVVDLGPEGGERGGQVVVTGSPEAVAACKASHTGTYLRALFEKSRSAKRSRPRRKVCDR